MFKITLKKKEIFEKLNCGVYESKIVTGRIVKTCEICKRIIQKGAASVTHTRKENRGTEVYSDRKKYITYHTCLNECNDQFNRKIFTQ